jgi:hypothetical protein
VLDGTIYVECECQSVDHVLRFTLDLEDKEVYTEVQLCQINPWYKRIWLALKYVFNRSGKWYWDTTVIRGAEAKKLISMLRQVTGEEEKEAPTHRQKLIEAFNFLHVEHQVFTNTGETFPELATMDDVKSSILLSPVLLSDGKHVREAQTRFHFDANGSCLFDDVVIGPILSQKQ